VQIVLVFGQDEMLRDRSVKRVYTCPFRLDCNNYRLNDFAFSSYVRASECSPSVRLTAASIAYRRVGSGPDGPDCRHRMNSRFARCHSFSS